MQVLEVDKLTKRFGPQCVIDDVSFAVEPGEFCILVGPSGSGKSTLLKLVAGLETVTAGDIRIQGESVAGRPPRQRDVAMVFQSYALYPHMSVFQNMAFPLRIAGNSREEQERRVREAARLLDIEDFLWRYPRELSGGQRQRVAIGRAIVRRPRLFLFDEPLSNLDARLRVSMRAELASLHRKLGATIVYVTHDQIEAMTLGTRLIVLDRGRVQQIGTPAEVYDRPQNLFVAQFIGSPEMNLMEGRLEEGMFLAEDLRIQTPATGTSPSLVLGVRPEDLSLHPGEGRLALGRFRVTLVENLGSEKLVHLEKEGRMLVARTENSVNVSEEEFVEIFAAGDRLHLFKEGRRLQCDE